MEDPTITNKLEKKLDVLDVDRLLGLKVAAAQNMKDLLSRTPDYGNKSKPTDSIPNN